jgi:TetR/AcrR family transcriptional repressor of nem operon
MARTGRPREFDVDEALVKARDVFWTKGYAATSIQDLVDDLAIQRASLYAAFGDKHSLFLSAVSLYVREGEESLEHLLDADPLLPALQAALVDPMRLIDTALTMETDGTRGCLVGNTAAELAPADEEVRELLVSAHAGTVRILTAALARAQATGEVTSTAPPEAQARMLLCLFQGYAVVTRAGVDPATLTAGLETAIAGLRA